MEQNIYGQTGEIGKDGLLTPDLRQLLTNIQQEAADTAYNAVQERESTEPFPLVAMATGFGKGNIIHRVIEKQVKAKADARILVIAGTKVVLVDQTHEALAQYQDGNSLETQQTDFIDPEDNDELTEETTDISEFTAEIQEERSFLYRTGKIGDADKNVHVATIQTLQSEMKKGTINPDDYDLVIADEVHNLGTKQRKATMQAFKHGIGFTATPFRHSGKMKTPEQYGFKIVASLPLPEAQNMRLLPPLAGIQIDTKQLIGEIPMTRAGKIDYKRLEKLLKNSPDLRPFIVDRVAKIISNQGRNYKTVIPVNFVWEAEEIAQLLKDKGIKVGIAVNKSAAKRIHSDEIPAQGALERYKLPEKDENSLQVLVSPKVASEGFDAPFTEVLVWASPTDSPIRYTQFTGRLARRAEGKAFGAIVDCLYQTSQYSWAYNMGMWMKGEIKQLDNGLLWLGPETDIDNLKDLPAMKRMIEQNDYQPIDFLQKELLLDIQEGDFPISQKYLDPAFHGNRKERSKAAEEIFQILKEEDSELVAERRNSGGPNSKVVTEKERFTKMMVERGFLLKDPSPIEVQQTDIIMSEDNLSSAFKASDEKIAKAKKEILEYLRETQPGLVVQRKNGRLFSTVVTNRDLVVELMAERGISFKNPSLQKIQPTDIAITKNGLSIFEGDYVTSLKNPAEEILQLLAEQNSELVAQRKSGRHEDIPVATQRELFIQMMIDRGFSLKDPSKLAVKPTEVIISRTSLTSLFRGRYSDLIKPAVEEIVQFLQEKQPELLVQRKNHGMDVPAVTDKDLFIKMMAERGIQLKENSKKENTNTNDNDTNAL